MDGQCVFRAQFEGRKFRIIEQDQPKREGKKIYWVYEGRRRIDANYWFSLGAAIGSVLLEHSSDVVRDLTDRWL